MTYRDSEVGSVNKSRDTSGSVPAGPKGRGFRDAEGAVNKSRSVGGGDPDMAIKRGFRDGGVGEVNKSRGRDGNRKTAKGRSGEGGN